MKLKYLSFCFLLCFELQLLSQNLAKPDTLPRTVSPRRVPKATLTRGPYLQAASPSGIVVRWRTDALSRSRVRYGTLPGKLDMIADDSSLVTEHIVRLTRLNPLTKYYYTIGATNDTLQGGSENYFMTLPEPGKAGLYRIGAFGDCGQNSAMQKKIRDAYVKYLGGNYMNAWVLLGDNAYPDGEDAQFQMNFFNVYKDNLLKNYPLFPSPGNHDYHDVEFTAGKAQQTHDIPYYKIFSMPVDGEAGGVPSLNQAYYSYDIGNIHFLSLDSYGKEENIHRLYDTMGPQVQWIKKDLEANKNTGWVIAYWHHPPYTMGSHNSDRETELVKIRENFVQILERYGVDLILCGHSHNYERSKLMKGHYGMEKTFDSTIHNLSQSSGFYDGSKNSCPYIKPASGNNGIVHVMSGSAGSIGRMKPEFPHDAMRFADSTSGGALLLEVEENRLDLKWICDDGIIRDKFTMMKDVNRKATIRAGRGETVTLTASFIGKYKWSNSGHASRSIQVKPPRGKTTYTVKDEFGCVQDSFIVEVSR